MGFYVNKEITTKLDLREVVDITSVFRHYVRSFGDKMDEEQKTRMYNLVNRLGKELYDNPDNDKPNGH